MKKICSCAGCNNSVEVGDFDRSSPRCSEHPLSYTPKKRYEHQHINGKHIYSSYRWKQLRKSYATANPICEHCYAHGMIEPLAVVDHILELEDGGDPYDYNNLQSLCHCCHNKKTASERKRRHGKGTHKSLNDF